MRHDLFGDDEPPDPRSGDRVFFAVRLQQLEQQASAAVRLLRRHNSLTGQSRPGHILHVTLLGIDVVGKLGRSDVESLRAAASSLNPPHFGIGFRIAATLGAPRPTPRPVVLEVAEGASSLISLAGHLRHAAVFHSVRVRGGALTLPHMTLLYDWHTVPQTPLPMAIEAEIRGFELIRSHWGETRYTTLWP